MQGWDDAAVFGTAEPIVRPRASTLILPTYEPRPLALTALVRSATAATLAAGINGQALPAVAVVPGTSTAEWQVPANALFRGDNVLTLEVSGAGAVVLDSLRVRASDAAR